MRGLDPRIHLLRQTFSRKMDGRVKPGNDALNTVPALRSGMKNAAPRPGHGLCVS
jgi:hypothetical protein